MAIITIRGIESKTRLVQKKSGAISFRKMTWS